MLLTDIISTHAVWKSTLKRIIFVAAIISRETRGNKALLNDEGFGSDGNGYGLMQVSRLI